MIAVPMLALALMTSSCSILKGSGTSKKNSTLPHDREAVAKKNDPKTYTPEELRQGIIKGDWAIETVYGHATVGEEPPFLKFEPSERKVYGNNGCNVINADYSYSPKDSVMKFDHVLSTMKMCQKQGLTDYEINTALASTKYYSWRVADNDYLLTFYDEAGREVMMLMHQNFDFLNGTWRVASIREEEIDVQSMKLVIDIDEQKLHGNSGCNVMNGNVEIDMDKPNSISFSAIAMTRMSCPDARYETALVVALEEVTTARPVSGTEVILYDAQHKPVMTLVRATDQ